MKGRPVSCIVLFCIINFADGRSIFQDLLSGDPNKRSASQKLVEMVKWTREQNPTQLLNDMAILKEHDDGWAENTPTPVDGESRHMWYYRWFQRADPEVLAKWRPLTTAAPTTIAMTEDTQPTTTIPVDAKTQTVFQSTTLVKDNSEISTGAQQSRTTLPSHGQHDKDENDDKKTEEDKKDDKKTEEDKKDDKQTEEDKKDDRKTEEDKKDDKKTEEDKKDDKKIEEHNGRKNGELDHSANKHDKDLAERENGHKQEDDRKGHGDDRGWWQRTVDWATGNEPQNSEEVHGRTKESGTDRSELSLGSIHAGGRNSNRSRNHRERNGDRGNGQGRLNGNRNGSGRHRNGIRGSTRRNMTDNYEDGMSYEYNDSGEFFSNGRHNRSRTLEWNYGRNRRNMSHVRRNRNRNELRNHGNGLRETPNGGGTQNNRMQSSSSSDLNGGRLGNQHEGTGNDNSNNGGGRKEDTKDSNGNGNNGGGRKEDTKDSNGNGNNGGGRKEDTKDSNGNGNNGGGRKEDTKNSNGNDNNGGNKPAGNLDSNSENKVKTNGSRVQTQNSVQSTRHRQSVDSRYAGISLDEELNGVTAPLTPTTTTEKRLSQLERILMTKNGLQIPNPSFVRTEHVWTQGKHSDTASTSPTARRLAQFIDHDDEEEEELDPLGLNRGDPLMMEMMAEHPIEEHMGH